MMLELASGWSSGHRKSRVLFPLGYLRVDARARTDLRHPFIESSRGHVIFGTLPEPLCWQLPRSIVDS